MTTAFSASNLPLFHAIYVPYQFEGEPKPLRKWFVILQHLNGFAICIKTTHRTEVYESDKERMAGCVFYKAGEVECFPVHTAIQPDNQFPISHKVIESEEAAGTLKVSALPSNFRERLRQAIKDSSVLSGRERARISKIVA
jgi:hypothetical protein